MEGKKAVVQRMDLHDLDNGKVDVVVLNWEISRPHALGSFIKRARTITCADGGYDRLITAMKGFDDYSKRIALLRQKSKVRVIGDMDSVKPLSLTTWSDLVVKKVVNDANTDFEKVLDYLREEYKKVEPGVIVVEGAFGGRMDQTSATLNALYLNADLRIHLLGHHAACCLLKPGRVQVRICQRFFTRKCELIALRPVSSITTCGFKRDVINEEVKIGGFKASSNELLKWSVYIDLTDPIIWSSYLNFQALEPPKETPVAAPVKNPPLGLLKTEELKKNVDTSAGNSNGLSSSSGTSSSRPAVRRHYESSIRKEITRDICISERRCFNCKEKGHIDRDCPLKQKRLISYY